MILVAGYLLLVAVVTATMGWGIAQVARFLARHPEIRDAQDLEAFKVFVRRDMRAAMAIMPLALVVVAGSVYMLIEFGFVGFLINLVVLVPSAVANSRLRPLVVRARNLDCANEELKAEHRRIAAIWQDNLFPRFEPDVRVSRSGLARMYVAFAIALLAVPAFWAVEGDFPAPRDIDPNAYAVISVIVACLLGILGLLVYRHRHQRPSRPLDQWFTVAFDDERVTLDVRPPGEAPSVASFRWSEITRICFKPEDFTISDGIYIFTTQRPESFVVPVEAKGGEVFWNKVIERGLFPGELAIQAATSREGALLCWPSQRDRYHQHP
jgi:hypothetical protein